MSNEVGFIAVCAFLAAYIHGVLLWQIRENLRDILKLLRERLEGD